MSEQEKAQKLWTVVMEKWTPNKETIANDETREEIKAIKRFFVLDVTFDELAQIAAKQLGIMHNPSIRDRDSGLKAYRENASAMVPAELRGKLREAGESKPLDNETKGNFILASSLIEKRKIQRQTKAEIEREARKAKENEIREKMLAIGMTVEEIENILKS